MSLAELEALARDHLIPTYARNPVAFVRGEGARLWDDEGNEYLDFLAGISVAQIGHAHPAWVAAVGEQVARVAHVGNLYYSEPSLRLAARLTERSLAGGKVFFTNSGAEANECAIKLARKRRRRGELVVLEHGFHGRTYGALSATPQEAKQEPFAPLVPGFVVVPRDDPDALTAAIGDQTAAVMIEPIQGECGIHPIEEPVLQAARAACDRHGALLVFDEIQCGMGRTGKLWAWQHTGVEPDVMTLAKGLGGGLPIGACIAGRGCADVLAPGDHGSTFAGGPVIAAGANVVLDVVDDAELLVDVADKGETLAEGLGELGLDGVRGRGLMLAFEIDDAPAVARRLLLEQRLVVNATGPTTIRLLPPLVVSREQIAEGLSRIAAGIAA